MRQGMVFSATELADIYRASLSIREIDALTTDTQANEDLPMPEWTKTLNDCLEAIGKDHEMHGEPPAGPAPCTTTSPPFHEIIDFFIDSARQHLKYKAGESYHLFLPSAHQKLEESLAIWLARLNALPMEFEFAVFRACRQPNLKRKSYSGNANTSSTYYEKFIHHLLEDRLHDYFKEYTVLARLMATSVDLWIEGVVEMIDRFKKDKPELERVFNDGKELGKVSDIKTSMSDRHNKGRSVAAFSFESRVKLVYKPKVLGIERVYNELIEWLNTIGSPVKQRHFKVLNFETYGWVEFIDSSPPGTPAETEEFYRRAGGLLCLTYVLGATDLHYENILGDGAYPVLVDLETLLHPFVNDKVVPGKKDDASTKARWLINDSVIRTGLLPYWNLEIEGQAYDVSGLGESMPQEAYMDMLRWSGINTDSMLVRKEKVNMYTRQEDPGPSKDHRINMDGHIDTLICGFSQTYHFLIEQRELILSSAHWNVLSDQTVRFIFRPTSTYGQIQSNLLHPDYLRKGIDRSRYLNILQKGLGENGLPPAWSPLVGEEQTAMEIMDIPHFSTRTDSTDMVLSSGKVMKDYFQQAGFDSAVLRLRQLDGAGLQQQIAFIKGAFICRNAENHHLAKKAGRPGTIPKGDILTKSISVQKGISIAAMLGERAIKSNDGSITWIGPRFHPAANRYQLDAISNDLYSGTGGIALFFSALFKITQDPTYKRMARSILQTTLKEIKDGTIIHRKEKYVGGGVTGYGGLIYGLLKTGLLLEEEQYTHAARKLAEQITEEVLDKDKTNDIMGGSAGTILSLLVLYKHFPEAHIADKLVHTGRHLLKRENSASTGFAHGTAGIAYSLLRLFEWRGDETFKKAALETLTGNKEPDGSICGWCHGATGIGLTQLAMLDIVNSEHIRKDIRLSLETTRRHLADPADIVCCGNLGRLELLQQAALKFSDRQLLDFTLKEAGQIIAMSETEGDFRYNHTIGFTPGFFHGIAGIGYQLLRLAHPESLPSVLILS